MFEFLYNEKVFLIMTFLLLKIVMIFFLPKLVVCMSIKGLMQTESLRNAAKYCMVVNRGNTQFSKHFTQDVL